MIKKIEKELHVEEGLQIKMILSPYGLRKEESNMWNLKPGSIHTIIDRPSRNSRKNGDYGIWVQGNFEPAFIWFFCWIPYFAPNPMQRTLHKMIRTKNTSMQRTK